MRGTLVQLNISPGGMPKLQGGPLPGSIGGRWPLLIASMIAAQSTFDS